MNRNLKLKKKKKVIQIQFSVFYVLYLPFFFRKPHIVCDKEPVSSLATCSILDLDRERTESVEVLLVASDQGSPPRTAAVSKTVKVTGVNDNAPYFLVHVQNVTVTEGVAKDNLYTAHVRFFLCIVFMVMSVEQLFNERF